jgi:hypothetical protein
MNSGELADLIHSVSEHLHIMVSQQIWLYFPSCRLRASDPYLAGVKG